MRQPKFHFATRWLVCLSQCLKVARIPIRLSDVQAGRYAWLMEESSVSLQVAGVARRRTEIEVKMKLLMSMIVELPEQIVEGTYEQESQTWSVEPDAMRSNVKHNQEN
jgi:hypothetical protein